MVPKDWYVLVNMKKKKGTFILGICVIIFIAIIKRIKLKKMFKVLVLGSGRRGVAKPQRVFSTLRFTQSSPRV